ncbi:hypothetical protein [Bradyrhizobium sp. WD16]|uniref:hypothetical protein n=1 Tax=Bradyrhizobium sp. WD16 TaxID=1521768 RepID=UPI0020A4BFF9|nr:hypothetical protein [Bradyrhizobium sp. WD16]
MAANARVAEVTAIGRLLADYNNLEIGLLHCVQQGIGDFDRAFKTMFGVRGETKRINAAQNLGHPAYQKLGLEADFDLAITAIRRALQIRNQYAHWTWWDDSSGRLAIANLEELAKDSNTISDFDRLLCWRDMATDPAPSRAARCLGALRFRSQGRGPGADIPVEVPGSLRTGAYRDRQ